MLLDRETKLLGCPDMHSPMSMIIDIGSNVNERLHFMSCPRS
jgi:hypothetical protein